MSRYIRYAKLIAIFGMLLVTFQNCKLIDSTSSFSTIDFSKITSQSSGNGGTYDGKMWGRLVPGFSCGGQIAPYATLQIGDQSGTLHSNCNQTKIEIPFSDLEFSKFSKNYVGYKDGLFNYSNDLQVDLNNGSFTEAWCQPALSKDSAAMDFEIGIHWQQKGKNASFRYYTDINQAPVETTVVRTLDVDQVNYSDSTNNYLQIQFLTHLAGSEKFPGNFSTKIDGRFKSIPVECRLGGQFDLVAPQLDYTENIKTLSVSESVKGMVPKINKTQAQFSISPTLPEGLKFDANSGEISGIPVQVKARKNYLVTATFDFGDITKALSIGVGQKFQLAAGCQSAECSLKTVLGQANALAPIPAIIELLDPNQEAWSGPELSITGDVELRGNGVIFDAQSLSRHFSVKAGATLSIQDMILKHGKSGYGGSISVEPNGSLHLKNVNFDSNVASVGDTGQGGAIYIDRGSLSLTDCVFSNNSTPMAGYNMRGGAIYIRYGNINPGSPETGNRIVILNSQFTNNSSGQGGAIYLENGGNDVTKLSQLKVSGSNGFNGAGIFLRGGKTVVENSTFENNSAIFAGGAIDILWVNKLWFDHNQFIRNTSQRGSAVSYNAIGTSDSVFFVLNTQFVDNGLSPTNLLLFPYMQGSVIYFYGNMTLGNTTFQSTQSRTLNCAQIYPSAGSTIFSLGANIFSDQSCGF